MKKIHFFVKKYFFDFSTTEANGFVVLIFLATCLLLIPSVLRFFPQTASSPKTLKQDEKIRQEVIAEIQQAQQQENELQNTLQNERVITHGKKSQKSQFVFEPFPFDPNKIQEKDWLKLGLKDYLAQRIEKYKAKGGHFKYKSDLRKIYGFPDWLYLKLEPYISLPAKKENQANKSDLNAENQQNIQKNTERYAEKKFEYTPKKVVIQPFDINSADTSTLRKISGIGSVLSQRIVKFRDNLGGFYTLDQLKEVYGLRPEVRQKLLKYARLDRPTHQKIRLNTATLTQLKSHPYIRYNLAKVLINYRLQHGNYTNVEDLKKIKILDDETLRKIKPYLSFD